MVLEQFIPQEYCLHCDVCCRFPENHTVWTPKFTREEVLAVVEHDMIPPDLFSQPSSILKKQNTCCPINLIEGEGDFRCPCFSVGDTKCHIYTHRPFECQLYPFLLLKHDGQLFLALDTKCPFIRNGDSRVIGAYKNYVQTVSKKKEFVLFLNQHRDLFSEYDAHDLDIVRFIHLE